MKKFILLVFMTTFLKAEFYKLEISRVEQNLYKTRDGLYIKTKFCFEFSYYEDVIYNDSTNELIFENGSKCDVEGFFK